MNKMDNLNREKMVDVLSNVVLEFADAQTAERLLRAYGFESEELEALGFEIDCEESETDSCQYNI